MLILAFVPGSVFKILSFFGWWALTFGRLPMGEVALYILSCALFTAMDVIAVRQGVLTFADPDFAGVPFWEVFLWGFYVLHACRMLRLEVPRKSLLLASVFTVLFAAVFALGGSQSRLLALSAGVLLVALFFFHEREDVQAVLYFVLMGAIVEYTGVMAGQWSYPEAPLGGVAPWFVTLWGGVGLFLRRFGLPLMARLRLLNTVPEK